MRSIRCKNGKWMGYNGTDLVEFEGQEEAIEWRNKGWLPKSMVFPDGAQSHANTPELVERFGVQGAQGEETTSFFVPSELLPDNGSDS